VYHGVSVPDPYRWLEDGEAQATREWVALQNERTRQALDARPDRGQWHERLVALMGLPVVLEAKLRGERLFALERAADAEQYALVLRSAVDRDVEPFVLFDPARVSPDGATAIDWFHPSPDGGLVAYGISEGGTEDSTLTVLDIDTGTVMIDTIEHARAASVAWLPDASAFYYATYPEGDEYNRRIMFHTLGSPPADDEVIWSDPAAPQSWPDVQISDDGRYLLVVVQVGWDRVDAFLLDRTSNEWATVVSGLNAASTFDLAADQLIISTTVDAPNGRVVSAPLAAPGVANWRTIVPEGDAIVGTARACGDELLVVMTEHAVDRVERWTPAGEHRGVCGEIGIASVMGVATTDRSTLAFITTTGFDTPATLLRYDAVNALQPWTQQPDASLVPTLSVSRATYPSRDGTSIGLFLIHRDDVVPGRDVPLILNGYGGFAITETPEWSPTIAAWCAQGGVYAIAGLRGGLEEGEAWHRAGRREHKQNVFDDFHAAADWLVSTGRASREHLAISGRSNGGLLVGVALTQRPDLCAAVWCGVPLLDMIRFPEFLIARLWTDEYGDPDAAEEFAWLWAYSPYHHVTDGTRYPAVLLTTAEGDTRVDPLHARKMAAALQSAAVGQDEHPILLHQEGRAGHGVGKPASKRADELADALTFFAWQLGGPA